MCVAPIHLGMCVTPIHLGVCVAPDLQVMSSTALRANEAVWQTVFLNISASVSRNFSCEHALVESPVRGISVKSKWKS